LGHTDSTNKLPLSFSVDKNEAKIMVKLSSNMQTVIIILFLLIFLEGGSALLSLSTSSYATGYQGAHAQYAGVRYKEEQFSGLGFDTMLHFDPDDPARDMCNLEGEMSSVFIPSESLSNMPSWVDFDWIQETSYISNPKETYDWTVDNVSYTMEAWQLRWYFSISANWDEPLTELIFYDRPEWLDRRYSNTEVWFELDLTPAWYFEGTGTAYFAIAKMKVAHVKLGALDNDGNEVAPDTETAVAPSSQGSILPIYYGLFAQQNPADKEVSDYKGKKLNPDLFTSKVYTYIRLVNFGTTRWVETSPVLLPVNKYKGDVMTVAVDVTVFVIGEWTVQDIEELEEYEDYGRQAQVGGGGWTWETFLANPANRALLVLIAGLAVLLICAIAFPSIIATLALLIQALTGGRKR